MERNELAAILCDEVLTVSEAAAMLGVTPQAVNNLVCRGRLIPIRTAPGANLFARTDIENYRAAKRKAAAVEPVEIYGDGSTRRAVEIIEGMDDHRRESIKSVALYLEPDDAVADGYVAPVWLCYPNDNRLIGALAPQCVLTFFDGSEIWLCGLTTGYGGTGPQGAHYVLTKILGVREEDADSVYNSAIARFRRRQGVWYLAEALPASRRRPIYSKPNYYYHRAKLVVAATMFSGDSQDENEAIVRRIAQLVQRPDHMDLLDRSEAIAQGYVVRDYCGIDTVYQVVIHDQSGCQAWISIPVQDDVPLAETASLKEILAVLEVPVLEPERSISRDPISRFLHANLPIFNLLGGKKNAKN